MITGTHLSYSSGTATCTIGVMKRLAGFFKKLLIDTERETVWANLSDRTATTESQTLYIDEKALSIFQKSCFNKNMRNVSNTKSISNGMGKHHVLNQMALYAHCLTL